MEILMQPARYQDKFGMAQAGSKVELSRMNDLFAPVKANQSVTVKEKGGQRWLKLCILSPGTSKTEGLRFIEVSPAEAVVTEVYVPDEEVEPA